MKNGKFEQTLRLDSRMVRCPLCHEWMRRKFLPENNRFVYACDRDRVAIAVNDPLLGKWEAAYERIGEKVFCPLCETEMRYFCTSTGYWKGKCPRPKCGTTIANPLIVEDKKK